MFIEYQRSWYSHVFVICKEKLFIILVAAYTKYKNVAYLIICKVQTHYMYTLKHFCQHEVISQTKTCTITTTWALNK